MPITFNLSAEAGADIVFFYDSNTDPSSGRTPILEYLAQSSARQFESAYSIFLPAVLFNAPDELNLVEGLSLLGTRPVFPKAPTTSLQTWMMAI